MAVRRLTHRGRVWNAIPTRVVADTRDRLVMAHWPGTVARFPASYASGGTAGDGDARFRLIDELADGSWSLVSREWTGTTMLTVMIPYEWFSVSVLFSGDDHEVLCWYVNFEVPFRRTRFGADTNDLVLDLVATPEGAWRWKDEDEYEYARRVGFISDTQHVSVEQARHRAVKMIETQSGPLSEGWTSWRREYGWPTPSLPEGWDVLEAET